MPELIDKSKVLKYLTPRIKTQTPYGEGYNKALEDAAALVALMPTIEPEVRQGEWVETEPDEDDRKIGIEFSIKCSRCHDENSHLDFNENHEITGKTFWKSRFCPNCGAKMDGGTDNG